MLVALVSILAHLPGMTSPLLDYHHHRQSQTAAVARNYHERGLPFLSPAIDWDGGRGGRAGTEFPLYSWLLGRLWGLWGLGPLWGRLLSTFFSALTAASLLRFLEGWLRPREALWGGLLFSAVPVEVYFGRTVQPEALALLLMVLSWLALDRLLGPGPERRQPARALLWAGATFAAGAAIGQKLPYAHMLAVSAALIWRRRGRLRALDPGWLHLLLSAGLAASWYLHARSGSGVVPASSGGLLHQLDWGSLPYFAFFQTVSRLPELGATYAGLVLAAVGAWGLRGRPEAPFLYAWWLCVWAYVVFGGGYVHTHEYSALPWAPVNAALMGTGAAVLVKRGVVLPALLVLAVPAHSVLRIRHWYRLGHPHLAGAEAEADGVASREELFLCNDYSAEACLYHLHRKGWGLNLESLPPADFPEIASIARKGARFLFTSKEGAFGDRGHPLSRWVRKRYPLARESPSSLIFRLR